MKTFKTNPGVNRFETGGPNGLVTIEAGKPLSTDDAALASLLETVGSHALTITDAAPASDGDKAAKAEKAGDRA
jgi:hypothetical protein